MNVLEVSPDLAEKIGHEASEKGLTVDEYLRSFIEPSQSKLTPQERAKQWMEWVESHDSSIPPLSDEAISRESIYTREDDMI